MDEAIRNAAVFGAITLAAGCCGWWPRWGWLGSVLVAVGGLVAAVALGVLDPLAPALWASAWPTEPLLLLAAWGLLGLGLRRLGGVGGWGPGVLAAFVGGAAFGALPVALGLAPGRDARGAAGLVLAAVAGGLCGPLGSAPMLLLFGPGMLAMLWPLGLALGLVAAVAGRSSAKQEPELGLGPKLLLAASPPLWLLAVLCSPTAALAVGLVLVAGLVAWRQPRGGYSPSWRGALSRLGLLVCVLLLVPAGVLDFLTWSLDGARVLVASMLDAGFGLATLGLGALLGAPPVGLAGALAASSDPAAFPVAMRAAIVAGAALGATIPTLRRAGPGVLRAGLGRWAAAVALLLGWLAWVGL
jgi:hypothetical protein